MEKENKYDWEFISVNLVGIFGMMITIFYALNIINKDSWLINFGILMFAYPAYWIFLVLKEGLKKENEQK